MVLKEHSSKLHFSGSLHHAGQAGAHWAGHREQQWDSGGKFAPGQDSTAHGPHALRGRQLWWLPLCQQGTNISQAKLADIFWRSLDWWANQSLLPSALILPCNGSGSKAAGKERWASQATDSSGEWAICWQKWHPCQFQTKSSILNALKLVLRLEKVKDIFNKTILNKKAVENQHNKELVACTLYKSHSAVISAPQFKVKATKTLYLDVTRILAASKYWSFNTIGWFAVS